MPYIFNAVSLPSFGSTASARTLPSSSRTRNTGQTFLRSVCRNYVACQPETTDYQIRCMGMLLYCAQGDGSTTSVQNNENRRESHKTAGWRSARVFSRTHRQNKQNLRVRWRNNDLYRLASHREFVGILDSKSRRKGHLFPTRVYPNLRRSISSCRSSACWFGSRGADV